MNKKDELDPRLADLLGEMKDIPDRNPHVAARARSKFLIQAVSIREEQRHSMWKIFSPRKEQFAMNLIISTLVIAGLLFGGGATVYAAQDDLPNESLYQIKLLTEETRLWLNTDPASEIQILMEQAQTRTEEVVALSARGIVPDAALAARTEGRIRQAMQLAASLDGVEMTNALQQIHARLLIQQQLMTQLQDGTCGECESVMLQMRDMLQTQLGQVEGDLIDPQSLRNQNQNQEQNQDQNQNQEQNQNQNQNQNQVGATESPVATNEPVATPYSGSGSGSGSGGNGPGGGSGGNGPGSGSGGNGPGGGGGGGKP